MDSDDNDSATKPKSTLLKFDADFVKGLNPPTFFEEARYKGNKERRLGQLRPALTSNGQDGKIIVKPTRVRSSLLAKHQR